jgi:hypothetical protein
VASFLLRAGIDEKFALTEFSLICVAGLIRYINAIASVLEDGLFRWLANHLRYCRELSKWRLNGFDATPSQS